MSNIRVAAFNAQDNADRCWDQITTRLEWPYVDVLALPEAYKSSNGLVGRLQASGLVAAEVPYNDPDGRADVHFFTMAGDPEIIERIEPIQLAGRTALRASVKNGTDLIGVHLDDRQEETRREQTQALLDQVHPNRPTIVMGDMNSMHRDDPRATALRVRVVAAIAEMLPQGEPGQKQSKIAHIGSLATRLTGMAEGGPIAMLEEAQYRDADPKRQATKGFVQLDHIMVPEWMTVTAFTVRPMNGLSDHCAVLATINLDNESCPTCLKNGRTC